MTVQEEIQGPVASLPVLTRRLSAVFGTGFGIAVGRNRLDLEVVRLRPSGPSTRAEGCISGFRSRPAAEWGAEIGQFLHRAGGTRLAATVLLPRDEVILRTLSMPGVPDQDVSGAVAIQADALHPYGDEPVLWDWFRCGKGTVMVGLVRRSVLEGYETLFSEAGVPLAAVTFAAAVIHPARRAWGGTMQPVLCFQPGENDRTDIYGESEGREVYSVGMPGGVDRALAVSRAELRLTADWPAIPLAEALGATGQSAEAWAAAVAGGLRRGRVANLLPLERRATHNRIQYVLPAVLVVALAAAVIFLLGVLPALHEKQYRDELDAAALRLEPMARQAQAAELATRAVRAKIMALDTFRRRPHDDLEVLNELTRLLQPPVWTGSIEISPDSVAITGEAEQAAPLLKILDSSPLFQNSEFSGSVSRLKEGEQFRIRTMRRGRTGRKTP